MNRDEVTGELVREWLTYDPECGVMRWKKKRRGVIVGRMAGHPNAEGYMTCIFFGKPWLVHRLIWLYVHDRMPVEIDHINGTRDDNRLCNIREVQVGENQRNTAKHRAGRLLGAYYRKNRGDWNASLWWNKKLLNLGYYPSAAEAHAAWRSKREELIRQASEQLQDVA